MKEGESMDITMCTANYCPMAHKCYRKEKSEANEFRQSYANLEYTCNEDEGFSSYIPKYINK